MKIKLFDSSVRKLFLQILGIISGIITIVLIFVDIPSTLEYFNIPLEQHFRLRVFLLFIFFIFLSLIYVISWIICLCKSSITLNITNSKIKIKYGDIFKEKDSLIVIGFNEYFDTIVDDKMISSNSLHGQVINNYYNTKESLIRLDKEIEKGIDEFKQKGKNISNNRNRLMGKSELVPLGKIIKVDNFLLLSLTRFNEDNEAYLYIEDYLNCLLKFWKEISRLCNGYKISIPLLCSKFTRIKGYEDISDKELLELMIITFKLSKKKISSKINIVLYNGDDEKETNINLLKLKEFE